MLKQSKTQISITNSSVARSKKNRIRKKGDNQVGKKKVQKTSSNAAERVFDKAAIKANDRKKENTIRKQKSRKRLRIAAQNGDAQAIEKLKAQRNANKMSCKNYRKRKKEKKQMKKLNSRKMVRTLAKRGDNHSIMKQESHIKGNSIRNKKSRGRLNSGSEC